MRRLRKLYRRRKRKKRTIAIRRGPAMVEEVPIPTLAPLLSVAEDLAAADGAGVLGLGELGGDVIAAEALELAGVLIEVLEADEALALLWEVLCIVTSTVVVEIAVKLVNVVDGRTVSVVVTGSGTGVMPSVVNSPLVSDERVNMADII
jgi:hypothetical protein